MRVEGGRGGGREGGRRERELSIILKMKSWVGFSSVSTHCDLECVEK